MLYAKVYIDRNRKGGKQPHPPLTQGSLPPGVVVSLLYGFCQCILSLSACVFCRYTIMQHIVSVLPYYHYKVFVSYLYIYRK